MRTIDKKLIIGIGIVILAISGYWVYESSDIVNSKHIVVTTDASQEDVVPDTTFEIRTWTDNQGNSYKLYIPNPARFYRDVFPRYDTKPDPLLEYDTLGWQVMYIPVTMNGEKAYMEMHNWERNLRYYWKLKETHKPTSRSFSVASAAPDWTWKYNVKGYTALIKYRYPETNLPDILKFGDTTVFINDWNVDAMPLLVMSHKNKLKYVALLGGEAPGDGFDAEMKLVRLKGYPYDMLQVKWSAHVIAKITDDSWQGIQIWDLKRGVKILDSYFGIDNFGHGDEGFGEETIEQEETNDSLLAYVPNIDSVYAKQKPAFTKDFIVTIEIENGEVVVSRKPEPNAIDIAVSDSIVTPGRYIYKNGKLTLSAK